MNVGARSISTGANFPSKAALKRAVLQDPSDVLFYSTEMFSREGEEVRASELTAAQGTLYVCGPDPYTSRKYYGQASRTPAGAVRVS